MMQTAQKLIQERKAQMAVQMPTPQMPSQTTQVNLDLLILNQS